jgi:hypothetical protein
VEGHELAPLLITACPHEAQSYGGNGDDVVEAVSMPAVLEAWIRQFVERHHVEEAFVKRKQKPKGDSGTGPAQLCARTNQFR